VRHLREAAALYDLDDHGVEIEMKFMAEAENHLCIVARSITEAEGQSFKIIPVRLLLTTRPRVSYAHYPRQEV
jgi:hypothetical protein